LRKVEGAIKIWSHALLGEGQREEIFKANCLPQLIALFERGAQDERFAACGAIYALAQSDKHIAEVVNARVIAAAVVLLGGEHDRSRLPAAQLLAYLASRLEYSARVAAAALETLLAAAFLPGSGPGWGGSRPTTMHCVAALRSLVENVQGELGDAKTGRRAALIAAGAVPKLVEAVAYVPRLPLPPQVPANPPAGIGKKGKSSKPGSKKKGAAGDARPPAGRKDSIATHCAAILRFLALCPGFVEELLACGSLPTLVGCLLTASEECCAYVAGILWEMSADQGVARTLVEAGAVRALLHTVSVHLAGAKAKGKGSGKSASKAKDGASSKSKDSKAAEPPPAPVYADIAVCNATGALHHLSFLDAAKAQIAGLGGAPILAACLKAANMQTYENASGALWNCGLDPAGSAALLAAGVPRFLATPVPQHWILPSDEGEAAMAELQQQQQQAALEAHTHSGPSFFLTQATQ